MVVGKLVKATKCPGGLSRLVDTGTARTRSSQGWAVGGLHVAGSK